VYGDKGNFGVDTGDELEIFCKKALEIISLFGKEKQKNPSFEKEAKLKDIFLF
jgi:hypothetical protein